MRIEYLTYDYFKLRGVESSVIVTREFCKNESLYCLESLSSRIFSFQTTLQLQDVAYLTICFNVCALSIIMEVGAVFFDQYTTNLHHV